MDSGFHVCRFRIPHPWIPDSTSMDSRFHNQQPGFWITIMVVFRIPLAGFWIPKPWIPDSTDQNFLHSRFRITLQGAILAFNFEFDRTFEQLDRMYQRQKTRKLRYSSTANVNLFPFIWGVLIRMDSKC